MNTAESADSAQVSSGSMCRFAVYGTLAPGHPNHHQLNDLSGRWIEGTVRGQLFEEGWGAELGYPGIVLDPDGPTVGAEPFNIYSSFGVLILDDGRWFYAHDIG